MTDRAAHTGYDDPTTNPPRTLAITGAGGNIGATVAERFRRNGWNLALFDRGGNVSRLRDAMPDALVVAADLTDAEQTASAVAEVRERFGAIDALAHLAGGFATGAAIDTKPQQVERLMDANFRTLFGVVRAVLPEMLERGRGTIVGIGARQALEGGGNATAYAAAKGAVLGYLRALRREVEPAGLGVGIVIPMGTIDTDENREAMPNADPAGWVAPEAVADAIAYLAERGPKGRVGELRLEAVKPAS